MEIKPILKSKKYRAVLLKAARVCLKIIPEKIVRKKLPQGIRCYLSIAFLSPSSMANLNRKHRGKNRPTDVLSFSRMESKNNAGDLGDVLLCEFVARQNASDNGVPLVSELQMLTVHGILHLFGYEHETNAHAKRMFRLQNKVLSQLRNPITI